MLNMSELVAVFLTEARELVEQLERGVLALEKSPGEVTAEDINAMFRAAHTIKGSAGVVGLDHVVHFTHLVETAFEQLRSNKLVVDRSLSQLLLRCNDHIASLLHCAEVSAEPAADLLQAGDALLNQLRPLLQQSAQSSENDIASPSVGSAKQKSSCHVFLKLSASCFTDGLDPVILVRYLRQHAAVCREYWYAGQVQPLTQMAPAQAETCQLMLDLVMEDIAEATLLEALEFIRQDSLCAIFNHDSPVEAQQLFLDSLESPTLAQELKQRWQALGLLKVPVEVSAGTTPSLLPRSETKAENKNQPRQIDQRMMRLPAYKLDTLVNQLGELLIATATLHEHSRQFNNSDLTERVQQVQQLVDDIQGSALQLRMVQIGETFNRFQRVVHDIAAELGKDVHLVIEGADAELDKSMVERISDPLMHLVRNALDHGLESASERIAAGKSAHGSLLLRAYHDCGSIVIEIRDDGRGINRDKVRQKAISQGLISAGAELTLRQIDELIFEPGFSTADAVSNLSGRGVGMDVVRRNIEALRGTVDISSEPGAGTQFQLRLPLTLAIIDGFMVRVGQSRFVIPLDMVNECIELPADMALDTDAGYLNLRGEVLPFIFLNQMFGLGAAASDRRSIVVVRYGKQSAGLVVDQLLGEFQTVIKPLGKLFQFLQGISGSSILGSGDIALILDIPRLVQIHVQATERQRTTTTI